MLGQRVMEFRVSVNDALSRRHDQRIRLSLWSAVLLLVGITIIWIVGVRSIGRATETALAAGAGTLVVGVVGAAYVLGVQKGIERAKRNIIISLTDDELIRQRTGWPDVRIALSEVKYLYERTKWLVVESADPRRRIAIPSDVERFDFLRSELMKHGIIVTSPRRSPLLALPTVASVLCWVLVFWSKEPWVVKAAACLALSLLAWSTFSICRLSSRVPKRFLLWATLGINWVAALWIIYSRLVRP
jgi:hypothetical protein